MFKAKPVCDIWKSYRNRKYQEMEILIQMWQNVECDFPVGSDMVLKLISQHFWFLSPWKFSQSPVVLSVILRIILPYSQSCFPESSHPYKGWSLLQWQPFYCCYSNSKVIYKHRAEIDIKTCTSIGPLKTHGKHLLIFYLPPHTIRPHMAFPVASPLFASSLPCTNEPIFPSPGILSPTPPPT